MGKAPKLPGVQSCAAHAARGVFSSVVPVLPRMERASLTHSVFLVWAQDAQYSVLGGKRQRKTGEHGDVIVGFGYHLPDDSGFVTSPLGTLMSSCDKRGGVVAVSSVFVKHPARC